MELVPGSRLGSHRLVARIRQDPFVETWRARDETAGTTVTIHLLRGVPEGLRSATSLRHPNLRTLHEIGHEIGPEGGHEGGCGSGVGYLVLETLSGETLAERLARSSLPVETILEVALGVASGLEALHGAGLVHGNLDPEKVFLSEHGPKLVDFGLGRTLRSFVPAVPRGTPPPEPDRASNPGPNFGHLAPEELAGERADARSDVFSFGTVLDEMISGPLPIADPGSSVPASLRSVVARCLVREPEGRYADGHELRTAVEVVVAEKQRLDASKRATAATRRRRIAAVWMLAAGIGALAVVDAFRAPVPKRAPLSRSGPTVAAPPHLVNTEIAGAPDPVPEIVPDPDGGSAHGAGD